MSARAVELTLTMNSRIKSRPTVLNGQYCIIVTQSEYCGQ